MITPERLRELLSYDPETGIFVWRVTVSSKATAGKVAGRERENGYRGIGVDGKHYFAHRLAWLHIYGCWPAEQIDHLNGNRADNRVANLREANGTQNQANSRLRSDNVSGMKGVSWIQRKRRWRATIKVNSKTVHLGYFSTAKMAQAAYMTAAVRHYGQFARAA